MYAYLNTEKNRELSNLLHDKGCKSKNDYVWFHVTDKEKDKWTLDYRWYVRVQDYEKAGFKDKAFPAFTFEDCIQRENAEKIFPDKPENYMTTWMYSSNVLHKYQRGDDWQQYIINHLNSHGHQI